LLRNSGLNKEQFGYVHTMLESGDALMMVIDDILDFSKIEAGKLELTLDSFDLYQLAEDVISLYKPGADKKGIHLLVDIVKNCPRIMVGDHGRIRQIMLNLINNAIKFTNEGDVLLKIEGHKTENNIARIQFNIQDSGIGIAGNRKKFLFNAFTQADTSTTRKYGGTGLGLAICKKLVTLMQGTIGVENNPDKGANFWFRLELDCAEITTHGNNPIESITNDINPERHTILLAEDNRVNQMVAKAMLGKMSFNVITANNGKEAVEIYQQQLVTLILMDMQMPEMDGLEASTAIRRIESNSNNHVPIIALTANALQTDKDKCLTAGMDYFMAKPIDKDELEQKINYWVVNSSQITAKKIKG